MLEALVTVMSEVDVDAFGAEHPRDEAGQLTVIFNN